MSWQHCLVRLGFVVLLLHVPLAFGGEKGEPVEIHPAESIHLVEHHFVPLPGGVGEMEVFVVEMPNGGKSAFVWVHGFDGKNLGGFGMSLSSDPDKAAAQKKWAEELAFHIALEHFAHAVEDWDSGGPGSDDIVLTDSNKDE